MKRCSGMLGKTCTCGEFHDTRPRPLILAPGVIEGPEPVERSLLASPWFWIGGLLSLLAWTGLYLLLNR